jgi:hypothetical protein
MAWLLFLIIGGELLGIGYVVWRFRDATVDAQSRTYGIGYRDGYEDAGRGGKGLR